MAITAEKIKNYSEMYFNTEVDVLPLFIGEEFPA